MNPGEPGGPGAAQQAAKNCLCLVVERVACSDGIQLVRAEQRGEPLVAQHAPGFLQAEFAIASRGLRVPLFEAAGNTQPLRQRRDKGRIGAALLSA